MSRQTVARIIAAIGLAVILCHCGDNRIIPYLGIWNGKFVVERIIAGSNRDEDKVRFGWKSQLRLMVEKKRFTLQLEGEQQGVQVRGTWTYDEKRATLTAKDVQIEDGGGEHKRDPNKKWIDAEAIRTYFGKPLVLNLSTNKRELNGLTATMGSLEGAFAFRKD